MKARATNPSTPRRVVVHRPGGLDRLVLEPFEPPQPGPGEVRVSVRAIGVNFADCLVRMGVYAPAKRYVDWPITPGFEVAGVVDAVGDQLEESDWPGRRVVALSRFNAYASHVVTSAQRALTMPDGWTMAEGAAFAVNALTAHHALHLADAPAGSAVLIHSAAGGVGHWLVQLARVRGLAATGVVGAPDKVAVVTAAGAEHCLVRGSFEERRLQPIFLAVFDAHGPESWRRSYGLLAPTGRLVVYGAHALTRNGRIPWLRAGLDLLRRPRFDPLRLCADNRGVLGFNLAYLFEQDAAFANDLAELRTLVVDGKARFPPITTLPLDEVREAHRLLQSGTTVGKLVLEIPA